MKSQSRELSRAFTLVELLATITIIAILAALVTFGVSAVLQRQMQAKAKVQIELLSNALEEYKRDMGHYPLTVDAPDPAGSNANLLYQALFHEGQTYLNAPVPPEGWTGARKIYLPDLDPVTSKQGWMDRPADGLVPASISRLIDPWGNGYRYRTSENSSGTGTNVNTVNQGYDLWSVGKDARTNGSPDQGGHPDNRDDIRNFVPLVRMASTLGAR